MSETKYGKYLLKATPQKSEHHPEIASHMNLKGGKAWEEVKLSMTWSCISQPFMMIKESHAHDFDQFLCFVGGNPLRLEDFGGEVELYLGEEEEKHIITATTIVYIPKGLLHGPLNFKRIDKPIMFHDILLSNEYVRKPTK